MRSILPGRPHSGRQAISTAYWNGIRLTAYVSQSAIVITTSLYSILQTIHLDCEPLQAVTIEEFSGRIAASNPTTVFVFEPVGQGKLKWEALGTWNGVLTSSLAATNGDTNGDTRVNGVYSDPNLRRASIPTIETVNSISWASAEELLVGGSRLQLWYISYDSRIEWDQELPYPVAIAYCSHDAGLIASCGQHDRLVKIWRRLSYESDGTRFDVSYLPHPSAVTNLHWRKPWHHEQNLDSLLYTFCTDGFVRAWAHTDPHSVSVMQKVASIDTRATIQPRRLSIGSISPHRYAFIIDSRDFSHATELAVENATNSKSDHALEHLIAIANRSPEICIILDGLGHMSAWGLENAGCKNKAPAEAFNVAHVDDVDLSLLQRAHLDGEHVQFCSFAGGSNPTSISLLVHSFDGAVAHYEAHIAGLFDTASRRERLQQMAAWAGHEAPVQGIIHNGSGDQLFTWTERDANIFSVDEVDGGNILEVATSRTFDSDIIDAIYVDDDVVVLLEESIQILPGRESIPLRSTLIPSHLIELDPGASGQRGHFAIAYDNANIEVWLPQSSSTMKDDSPSLTPAPVDQNGHIYLHALYTTPASQSLPYAAIQAASLSTSQDILTNLTLQYHSAEASALPWSAARRTLLPLWLIEPTSLTALFEQIARTEYTSQSIPRSPVPCSLFYLALRQKALLLSLWRTAHGVAMRDPTMKLLGHDFSEARWKETALKNAYALMSKRRFEYAAAWFLLGGRIRDAVLGVLVGRVGDWVLGIAVARVWLEKCDGEKERREGRKVLRELLTVKVLEQEAEKLHDAREDNEANALREWAQRSLHNLGDEDDDESESSSEAEVEEDESVEAVEEEMKKLTTVDTASTAEDEKKPASGDEEEQQVAKEKEKPKHEEQPKKKPPPSQFVEPSADSLLDSFGF